MLNREGPPLFYYKVNLGLGISLPLYVDKIFGYFDILVYILFFSQDEEIGYFTVGNWTFWLYWPLQDMYLKYSLQINMGTFDSNQTVYYLSRMS